MSSFTPSDSDSDGYELEAAGAKNEASPQIAYQSMLTAATTEAGRTLNDIVRQGPVLLVFLRHFGCSFCRRTLDEVSQLRAQLTAAGAQIVFVHLGTPERAKPYFDYYRLSDVERISNPDQSLYRHAIFQLPRVHLIWQVFRPEVWKGWMDGSIRKHGIGMVREDGFQMPGIFFLKADGVAKTFRYRTIADRPPYLKLVS